MDSLLKSQSVVSIIDALCRKMRILPQMSLRIRYSYLSTYKDEVNCLRLINRKSNKREIAKIGRTKKYFG